jgi:hypothetical protein
MFRIAAEESVSYRSQSIHIELRLHGGQRR